MVQPSREGVEAGVGLEPRDAPERLPLAVAPDRDHAPAVVTRTGVAVVRGEMGRLVPDRLRLPLVDEHVQEDRSEHVGGEVDLGDVDHGSPAGGAAGDQRRDDGDRDHLAGQVVGVDALRADRTLAARMVPEVGEAGVGRQGRAPGAVAGERSRRAEAGHPHDDEVGPLGEQLVGADSEALHDARTEVVHDDIAVGDELLEQRDRLGVLEVQGQRAGVQVHLDEARRRVRAVHRRRGTRRGRRRATRPCRPPRRSSRASAPRSGPRSRC